MERAPAFMKARSAVYHIGTVRWYYSVSRKEAPIEVRARRVTSQRPQHAAAPLSLKPTLPRAAPPFQFSNEEPVLGNSRSEITKAARQNAVVGVASVGIG